MKIGVSAAIAELLILFFFIALMCSFNRLIKCLLVSPIHSCFISLLILLLQVFKQILHCKE